MKILEVTYDNLDGQYRHQQDTGVADLSRASWTSRREAETGLKTVLLSSMPVLPYVCRTCPVCLTCHGCLYQVSDWYLCFTWLVCLTFHLSANLWFSLEKGFRICRSLWISSCWTWPCRSAGCRWEEIKSGHCYCYRQMRHCRNIIADASLYIHLCGCITVAYRCNIVTCRYSSRRQTGRLVVGGTRTLSSFSQDWGARSLMRSRSSKDGVLLFFKPYVVFVLLVILNKWFTQHNSFRICELCSYLWGSGERFKWVFSTSHFQWYILWEVFCERIISVRL